MFKLEEYVAVLQPAWPCIGFNKKEHGGFLFALHQKLGFTDTDLAESFKLADNIATTNVFYSL